MMPFSGEGQVRELLRAWDWSGFPLGDPPAWPGSLKMALQLMLDSHQPACLAWGPGLHIFYNDSYIQLLGGKHPAALMRPLWEVWQEVEQVLKPAVEQALKGEPCFQENMPYQILRNGNLEDIRFTFSLLPIRGDDGEVAGVLSLVTETTDQVEAELCQRFLLALSDRLRPLEAPDEITAVACEMLGRQLNASRVFYCEVDDQRRTFFIRKDWVRDGFTSVAGETRRLDDFGPEVIKALSAAEPVIVTDVTLDPRTAAHAEAYRGVGLRAYLVIPLIKSGRLISLLSVHSDVPRRWRGLDRHLAQELIERTWAAAENADAQAELRQAVARLREGDAHKDEFLAMLAHELRNPLAPIRSAAELLQRAQLDEARVRKISEIIGRQVDHITSLVNDLLDVSRVTRGLVELENMPVDMARIVRDAVEQVQPLIESKNHHLELQLSPDAAMVMGDEKRLVQVVANLLNNAAKYTRQGGHILVKTEARDAQVLLSVRDDGIGIAPELAVRVFDLFTQAKRTSDRSGGGLGLGLALVKSIVELHGGSVTCASEGLGRGSLFTVSLPQLPLQAGQPQPPQAALLTREPGHCLKVMIVDDNADAAQMLGLFLQASGHQVMVENGARQALERSRVERPDACLLDIGLPGIDGLELARLLRQQPETRHAVLIAITGYGQDHDREAALAGDFDHYFVKPVDTRQLEALLAGIRSRSAPAKSDASEDSLGARRPHQEQGFKPLPAAPGPVLPDTI
jgi:signal transduction histidine kinase/DNA-binding NarL/FixJ family response regulator